MRRAAGIAAVVAAAAMIVWFGSRRSGEKASTEPDHAQGDGAREEGGAGTGPATRPRSPIDFMRGHRLSGDPVGPPGQVEGQVLDATTGEQVPGVDVLFRGAGGEAATTSDAQGRYEIALAPGRYGVRAFGDGILAVAAPDLQVAPDRPIRYDVTVQRLASLRGRVIDERGNGVSGVEVRYAATTPAAKTAVETGALVESTTSGGDGDFWLDVLPGEAQLAALAGRLRGATRVEKLGAGEIREGLTIMVTRGASVTGVVLDPSGRAASGAEVHATVRLAGSDERAKATSGADGRFRFEDLPAGAAVLEARSPRHAQTEPTEVTLAPGASESITLRLQAPRLLAGRVVDEDERPLVGARVRAGRGGSRLPAFQTESAHDGTFSFDAVDGGPYWVSAFLPGRAVATREQVRPPVDDLELRISVPGGVRGRVQDVRGSPVGEFVVTVVRQRLRGVGTPRAGGAGTRFSTTDGSFEMFPLEPGSYDLEVSAAGFAPTAIEGVAIEGGSWNEIAVDLAREPATGR